MIDIFVTPTSINAVGHAGTAPKGHDLVCAAVSTTLMLMAEMVQSWERRGYLEGNAVDIRSGYADIRYVPKAGHAERLAEDWMVFGRGLAEMERTSPWGIISVKGD